MLIYHHNDLDGRCSAAIVYYAMVNSGKHPEDILCCEVDYKYDWKKIPMPTIDEEVVIVDFSFRDEHMAKLVGMSNNKLTWIDHHQTILDSPFNKPAIAGIRTEDKAACELTWEYFLPNIVMPWAVKYIGDHDAWKFKYGNDTRNFIVGMMMGKQDPRDESWRMLFVNGNTIVHQIKTAGRICLNYRDNFLREYRKSFGFETEFDGHKAYAIGLCMFGSYAFGEKLDEYPLCISFEWDGRKWTVGLYSKPGTINVADIAKKYSGGGHPNAAGMILDNLPFKRT